MAIVIFVLTSIPFLWHIFFWPTHSSADMICTLKYRIEEEERKIGQAGLKIPHACPRAVFHVLCNTCKEQRQECACAQSLPIEHWRLGHSFRELSMRGEIVQDRKKGGLWNRQRDGKEKDGKRKKERKRKNNRKNVVYLLTWHHLWKSPQGSPCAFPRRSLWGGWRSTR